MNPKTPPRPRPLPALMCAALLALAMPAAADEPPLPNGHADLNDLNPGDGDDGPREDPVYDALVAVADAIDPFADELDAWKDIRPTVEEEGLEEYLSALATTIDNGCGTYAQDSGSEPVYYDPDEGHLVISPESVLGEMELPPSIENKLDMIPPAVHVGPCPGTIGTPGFLRY